MLVYLLFLQILKLNFRILENVELPSCAMYKEKKPLF